MSEQARNNNGRIPAKAMNAAWMRVMLRGDDEYSNGSVAWQRIYRLNTSVLKYLRPESIMSVAMLASGPNC